MMRVIARGLLRLLPREFRQQFGDDLFRAWQQLRADSRQRGGRLAEWRYLARELAALVRLVHALRTSASEHRPRSGVPWVDLRDVVRRFRQRPVATVASISMLTMALAAATVAFGVGRAVLWRPLPFADESRLVFVWERSADGPTPGPMRVTGSRFVDWTRRSLAFDSLAAFGAGAFQVEQADGVVTVRGVQVSAGFFETLGVMPVVGRGFTAADHEPGATGAVILSDAYWRRHHGGDRRVVGQTIRIGGQSSTVIGVLPDVWLPAWPVNPASVVLDPESRQLWVPMPLSRLAQNRRAHVLGVIGRLARGRTLGNAEEDLQTLASADQPDPHGAVVRALRGQVAGGSRPTLLVLLAAALSVWLVAVLNLAALRLADFEQRRADVATRLALGATVGRVSRSLCLEAAFLVATAAGAAVLVTHLILRALPARLSAQVPFVTPPRVDASILAVVAALAAVTVVIMTVWPLMRLRGIRGIRAQRSVSGSSAVFRGLVVAQLAGAVVLVATSAALVRSSLAVQARDTGFDMRDVWVMDVSLPQGRYASPESIVAFEDLLGSQTDPGAWNGGFTLAYDHPLEANWIDAMTLVGGPTGGDPDSGLQAQLRIVSPSYFAVMRVRSVDGRTFGLESGLGDSGAVVVNEAFARHWQVGVGRTLRLSAPRGTWGAAAPDMFTVVGVVADERITGREGEPAPSVYVSTRQFPQSDMTVLGRRSAGRPDAAGDLRMAVRAAESGASVGSPQRLEGIDADQRLSRTLTTDLVTAFAGLALLLSSLGLHGLLSLAVASRRKEIGIRLALGATRGGVASLLVRDSLRDVGLGLAAGLALSRLAADGTRVLLVDAGGSDVWIMSGVAALMVLVAAVASAVPARRASRVDPVETLGP